MSGNDSVMRFLYGTVPGRAALGLIQKTRAERVAVRFLHSPLSRPLIARFARAHHIPEDQWRGRKFRSCREFFIRRLDRDADMTPDHLISPCDGWLSVFPIEETSSFSIKRSRYRVADLLGDAQLAERFRGGMCMIFRLCASDYHRYCFIDDAVLGENHFIPGVLHSVQPIACERYPVYTLNRRSWCRMDTEHFGTVVQTEIGALVVGGIVNHHANCAVHRGEEKGYFDLAGSTITLFFEPGRVTLRPEFARALRDCDEVRVERGQWIGNGGRA